MACNMASLVFSVMTLLLMAHVINGQALQKGFYSRTCPKAEDIVRAAVQEVFNNDETIAPGLLRLHFHDCFVQGCDASVLISGDSTERTAFANANLRGFEVIDDAKSQLESVCPGTISCADIIALAARDAVGLTGGPSWSVELGRRDGTVSSASDVSALPAPTDSVDVQRQKFSDKGLSDHDLVTLVGAHTIGTTACRFVKYRLFNFTATGNPDPTISPSFLSNLQTMCPQSGDSSNRIAFDKDTANQFDVSFFKNVRDGNAVLESDQRLWSDSSTKIIVQNYAGNIRGLRGLRFNYDFPKAMVKMGAIGVKTGSMGEIRETCSVAPRLITDGYLAMLIKLLSDINLNIYKRKYQKVFSVGDFCGILVYYVVVFEIKDIGVISQLKDLSLFSRVPNQWPSTPRVISLLSCYHCQKKKTREDELHFLNLWLQEAEICKL